MCFFFKAYTAKTVFISIVSGWLLNDYDYNPSILCFILGFFSLTYCYFSIWKFHGNICICPFIFEESVLWRRYNNITEFITIFLFTVQFWFTHWSVHYVLSIPYTLVLKVMGCADRGIMGTRLKGGRGNHSSQDAWWLKPQQTERGNHCLDMRNNPPCHVPGQNELPDPMFANSFIMKRQAWHNARSSIHKSVVKMSTL